MNFGSNPDPNAELQRLSLKYKFIYSIVGLFLGLSCILSGLALGLAGAVGHSSFTASFIGLQTQINDAAPGVIVFVVGIFMVLITRFRVFSDRSTTTYSRNSSPDVADQSSALQSLPSEPRSEMGWDKKETLRSSFRLPSDQ